MAGVKGMKHRGRRAPKSTDAAVLTLIENRLKAHVLGECEMSPTQVMAARAVYDKLRPSLSAIESTVKDPRDAADPQQLVAKLAAMFHEKPGLLEQVIALRDAATVTQQAVEQSQTQVKH